MDKNEIIKKLDGLYGAYLKKNVTIQPPLQKHKAYRKQQRKQP